MDEAGVDVLAYMDAYRAAGACRRRGRDDLRNPL
jgi:hypothetical protein